MNDLSHGPAGLPQLRTLLLTDLCDSTALVERLGDAAAAGLFQAHDRLVLQLQQRWRGRLIDRSDGLLLLFERPIDGLGFALDYAHGLIELGRPYDVRLQARAGLHVGEVLTWRNSDEAVRVGAKPLEVEGLAKPMAGRLMALARPGQILLSAVAEPLTYRAARELGERAEHLVWKSHGRWNFKGVPGTQEIFEVGEPGIAPLRMPASTAKAWRDIPLWRRPAALAAELALIAGLGGGLWFATRPQPAIAFGERDWVVVGDLRNLTGDKLLDDSLEQAFRISLEQSRYVNVLSDLKARETLQRMRRPADTPLDRAVASEVALRDGVRAVILPMVAEVGGRIRVSAEVVDPHTQATVYAESADGDGAESTLTSIDRVTSALRGRLGEAIASVQQTSSPLPQVSTASLDALKAYGVAEQALHAGSYDRAEEYYQRAAELDPGFALSMVGQMRVRYARSEAAAARDLLRRAQALRSRLPVREALYLDAWATRFDDPARATSKWQQLAELYPDYWRGQSNAAMWLFADNRFPAALAYASTAQRSPDALPGVDDDTAARALMALGRYDEAAAAFRRAVAHRIGGSQRRLVGLEAARSNVTAARALEAALDPADPYSYFERGSLAIDQARWADATRFAAHAMTLVEAKGGFDTRNFPMPVATTAWLTGRNDEARRHAALAADRAVAPLAQRDDPDAEDDAATVLAAALVIARLGDVGRADALRRQITSRPWLASIPEIAELAADVSAEGLIRRGQAEEAVALLTPFLTGHELYQTRRVLFDAYRTAGHHAAALEQARWLQTRRGQAYAEQICGYCLQSMNVADSTLALLGAAEALHALDQPAKGAGELAAFDRRWPTGALPAYLRSRRLNVSASKVGTL